MSSGIGVKGTLGRCYPFYADLRKCVVSVLAPVCDAEDIKLVFEYLTRL